MEHVADLLVIRYERLKVDLRWPARLEKIFVRIDDYICEMKRATPHSGRRYGANGAE